MIIVLACLPLSKWIYILGFYYSIITLLLDIAEMLILNMELLIAKKETELLVNDSLNYWREGNIFTKS